MKATKLLETQREFDQTTDKLTRIDSALDEQRAALAAVTADDAELAALKRQRQTLLADHHLAQGKDAERLAGEIATHDRKLADRQAAADRIGDVLAGLEAERARLAEKLVDIHRRLTDERHAHIVETLGTPALNGYLKAAGGLFTSLIEIQALERVARRLHGRLKSVDPEGARERNPVKFLWSSEGAELPRPHRQFTEGRDLAPLPADRPGDSYQQTLWNQHEIEQRVAAREQELLEALRQQNITID